MSTLRFDVGLSLLLLAIVLLDGAKLVPRDALVLHRWHGGDWRVGSPPQLAGRSLVLLGLAPLSLTIVPLACTEHRNTSKVLSKGKTNHWRRVAMNLNSIVILSVLVLATPLVFATYGGSAFALCLLGLVALSTVQATLLFTALQAVPGRSRRENLRSALPVISPFSAGRGSEIALQADLRHLVPLEVAGQLLRPQDLAQWLRPRAYDALVRGRDDPELVDVFSGPQLMEMLNVSMREGRWYCPRCGTGFVVDVLRCDSCDVRLEEHGGTAPHPL